MHDMSDEPQWITTEEAVEMSGYHVNYLRQLIKDGKVNGRKFGPVWQVDSLSLMAYIDTGAKTNDRRYGSKR